MVDSINVPEVNAQRRCYFILGHRHVYEVVDGERPRFGKSGIRNQIEMAQSAIAHGYQCLIGAIDDSVTVQVDGVLPSWQIKAVSHVRPRLGHGDILVCQQIAPMTEFRRLYPEATHRTDAACGVLSGKRRFASEGLYPST